MSRRMAGLMAVMVVLVAGCFGPPTVAPATTPPASTAPTDTPAATAAPTPAPTAAPKPSASPVAVIPTCTATQLAARITSWDSGAGSRFAHVQVTNAGSAPCRMKELDRPQLVDGHGAALIDGAAPAASAFVTLTAGAVLKTDVQVSNYCGPDALAPVSVAFVFPGGTARFVATPTSASDTSGVPPCLGNPGSAGSISMTAWKP